jgi:hypothetical protein
MNNQIISIAYSAFINKGAFALLLGSGISRKSGIPTGWEITLKLINQIVTLERQDPNGDLEQWYKDYFGKDPDYSDILEQLTNTPEERLNLLRPFIEPDSEELEQGLKTPTIAHKQIARLVKEGYVKVIVTTNFDRLLENSLKDLGVEPTVISNPEHIENSIPLIHSNITIIKINGDYLDTKFLNIKSELEQYDPRLVDMLKFIFENYGLITCGWSAQWDIALVSILKSANKFRYSNYFTYLSRVNSDLNDLSNFRKGQLVKINDADSFFTEFVENVEALEKGNDQHPLSSQIVLQRLKKYIVKEEYIISLHDLFQDIADDFAKKISTIHLQSVPNLQSIKEIRDLYLSKLDLLANLLVNGSFWSKQHHYTIIANTLKRIAVLSEQNNISNYVDWGNAVYLPSLILRYACGISCIAQGNYKLLRLISLIEFKGKYQLEKLDKVTNPYNVIEKEKLNAMDGNNRYIPMSEFIFTYLRPYFMKVIPVDSDYDSYFNYYEFIYSITYPNDDRFGLRWFPIGRYGYKHRNLPNEILKRAEEEGASFELINAGFFKTIEELKSTFDSFNEYYSKIHYF